jgi:large conductance mechanosensitive channel
MYQYVFAEFSDFFNFLLEKNIFQTGVSIIIASQVSKLMFDTMNSLVAPVISKTIDSKIETKTAKVFGIEFKIGAFIMSLINFLIIMLLIYYLFRISKAGNGFIQNFTSKIKSLFR